MNPFISISEGISRLFQQGTDRFTRMLPINSAYWFQNLLQGRHAVYETIDNNEFNLFITTPEIYIPIMKKAAMFSNGLFVVKDYKTGEVIENHPLLKLLEKPNPMMNRNEWLIDIVVNYSIYGASYIYKNQPSTLSEQPQTLVNLPNSEIIINTTGVKYEATELSEIIESYKIKTTGQKFDTDEVITVKNYSKDGIKGISMLNALNMPVSNGRAMYGFLNVNATKKGALGVISSTGSDSIGTKTMTDEERLDLEKQFTETHGIFDGQNPIKISNSPIKYDHLAYPIKDQLAYETINHLMRRVIDSIGLNENLFSAEKQSTFSNQENGVKSAYQDCIIPFSEMFCYALNDGLNLFEKGIYVELDYSHIPALQENETDKANEAKSKSEAIERLVSVGYTRQQAEELLGLNKQ